MALPKSDEIISRATTNFNNIKDALEYVGVDTSTLTSDDYSDEIKRFAELVDTITDLEQANLELNNKVTEDNSNFSDIYDAIVEKGQTPVESDRNTYADAILAIETGSEPVGASTAISRYINEEKWKTTNTYVATYDLNTKPYAKGKTLFELNNEIHLLIDNAHYKFNENTQSFDLINNTHGMGHNGVVIGDSYYYKTNSGSTWYINKWNETDGVVSQVITGSNSDYIYDKALCTDGTYLYIYGYSTDNLYVYDVSTNTLVETINDGTNYNYLDIVAMNNCIYGISTTALYKLDLSVKTWEKIIDLGYTISNLAASTSCKPTLVIVDDSLYLVGGNTTDQQINKYDGQEYTTVTTDGVKCFNPTLLYKNNCLYCVCHAYGTNATYGSIMSKEEGTFNYIACGLNTECITSDNSEPAVIMHDTYKTLILDNTVNYLLVEGNNVVGFNIVDNKVLVREDMTLNGEDIVSTGLVDISDKEAIYIKIEEEVG